MRCMDVETKTIRRSIKYTTHCCALCGYQSIRTAWIRLRLVRITCEDLDSARRGFPYTAFWRGRDKNSCNGITLGSRLPFFIEGRR